MPEVIGAFSSTELRYERANCPVETWNGSLGGLAQESFEFAVRHLDRVEVRRVLRQITQCRLRFLDRLSDAGHLVGRKVVYHDDVVSLERGNQALLDIGQEHLSVHGSLEHHRGGHFVVTQGGHEGDRRPFSKRNAADQSDAARGPASQPHHIGADRSLVDKYQPRSQDSQTGVAKRSPASARASLRPTGRSSRNGSGWEAQCGLTTESSRSATRTKIR